MRIVLLFLLLTTLVGQGAYLGDISTTHSVTNLTALEALVVPDKTPVLLKGYYVEGDSPAVTYVFAAGDTSTVDNGSVVTNAATVTDTTGAISTVTQTPPTDGSEVPQLWGITTLTVNSGSPVTTAQVKSSTNITVYLVGSANFSAGSVSGYGSIKARRAR